MTSLEDMTREELIARVRQLEERLAEEGIGIDRGMPDWLTISGDIPTDPNTPVSFEVSAVGSFAPARVFAVLPNGEEVEINPAPDGTPLPPGVVRLGWIATAENMSID